MVSINVRAEFSGVRRRLKELSENVGNRATAAALNRVGDQARTGAVREISSAYNIKQAQVRERIKVRKAFATGRGRLFVEIVVESKHGRRATNLITFKAKQLKRGGVSVKIRRDKPPLKGKNWFVITNRKTGGTFVAKRTGTGRAQIQSVVTIDVGQMFNAKRINAKLLALVRERFPKEFEHQVSFYLAKFNAA